MYIRLFDEAVEELRPVLVRRGARQEAALIGRENLDALMAAFSLRPRVLREDDGSVTITVDELDWAVNAASAEEAASAPIPSRAQPPISLPVCAQDRARPRRGRAPRRTAGPLVPPTFRDLKRFCERDRWALVRSTDQWYYEKVLPDGRVLRTKVSRALHREIPGHLWQSILKHQLQILEEEFWKKIR